MGVLGPGRCLKSFLDVFSFILTEYQLIYSHGDPKLIKFCLFCTSNFSNYTTLLNSASKFEYFIASPAKFPFQEGSSLQDLSMDNLNPPDLNSGEKPPRVCSYFCFLKALYRQP